MWTWIKRVRVPSVTPSSRSRRKVIDNLEPICYTQLMPDKGRGVRLDSEAKLGGETDGSHQAGGIGSENRWAYRPDDAGFKVFLPA